MLGRGAPPSAVLQPLALALAAAVLLTACGGDKGVQASSDSDNSSDVGSGEASIDAADQEIPDACTFLRRDEVSAAIGRDLQEGEPQSTVDGASECRFETALGLKASTEYDDSVIPETALGSVTVNTHPSDPEEFDAFQESLGPEAEIAAGVGDDAYFWGNDLIYVRVANRGFSIRITADETEDQALQAALLELAAAGASNYQDP